MVLAVSSECAVMSVATTTASSSSAAATAAATAAAAATSAVACDDHIRNATQYQSGQPGLNSSRQGVAVYYQKRNATRERKQPPNSHQPIK
jgi:hypothetical protein